jgi:hypothetical protein
LPQHKSDRHELLTAHDTRVRPPRSLAELNRFFGAHYRRKAGR